MTIKEKQEDPVVKTHITILVIGIVIAIVMPKLILTRSVSRLKATQEAADICSREIHRNCSRADIVPKYLSEWPPDYNLKITNGLVTLDGKTSKDYNGDEIKEAKQLDRFGT